MPRKRTGAKCWTRCHFTILILGAALACSGVGCVHYGQRLLEARIERDGQVVLRTHFGVPDNWDQRTAWRQLESQLFEVEDPTVLGADVVGRATLKGRIRITLTHAGSAWAAVEVDEIQLSQQDAESNIWRFVPGECERTARALGRDR
jgi:hypothetical protein